MDLIIELPQGKLQGGKCEHKGRTFYKFQGIPYGKPPLGELRFKEPRPAEPWSGILDATQERDECFARHLVFDNFVGSEDCLFLNVYTPKLPRNESAKLLPVMVWIHGGAFTKGSSNTELYGPEFLMEEDIVLVTFNYRLGILGFLSLEDPSLGIPGNAGLKDMVMVLKWVQTNISRFSGDKNNVTIFGESAGGAAVHYLMLSPLAKGLFHKAIAQSGVALNCWAEGTRCATQLAQKMGITYANEKDILDHFRKVSVEELLVAQGKIKDELNASKRRPLGPIVEQPSTEKAFLLQNPTDIISSGNYNKVPFLLGYTSREGMLAFYKKMDDKRIFVDFEDCIPFFLNIPRGTNHSKQMAQKIKEFYYGNEEPTIENIDNFYKLQTDSCFLREIYKALKLHLQTSVLPLYFYRFSLEAGLNLYKTFLHVSSPGASHADDLGYLFKTNFLHDLEPGTIEDVSVRRMVILWTNFAKYGDPNPPKKNSVINVKWKPVTMKEYNFIDLDKELKVGVNPDIDRINFWNSLIETESVSKL